MEQTKISTILINDTVVVVACISCVTFVENKTLIFDRSCDEACWSLKGDQRKYVTDAIEAFYAAKRGTRWASEDSEEIRQRDAARAHRDKVLAEADGLQADVRSLRTQLTAANARVAELQSTLSERDLAALKAFREHAEFNKALRIFRIKASELRSPPEVVVPRAYTIADAIVLAISALEGDSEQRRKD